jgi:integrase
LATLHRSLEAGRRIVSRDYHFANFFAAAIVRLRWVCVDSTADWIRVPLTEAGQPYSVSTINRHFKKAKTIAGIVRRFRFHDLRHSFASLLASRGVSIQVIAKALGHSSPSTSERYARPSEESLRSVTEALDSAQNLSRRAATPSAARLRNFSAKTPSK